MEVEVAIQGRPETLYEGNGAALRFPLGAELASAPNQGSEHRFREDTQNVYYWFRPIGLTFAPLIGNDAGVVSQPVAEGVRKREHPLQWQAMMTTMRALESEATLIGASAHIITIAAKLALNNDPSVI